MACAHCGATLADALLEGLCPRCLAAAALAEAPPAGPVVGDYVLLAEIGRGGMGVVHLARQRNLDRLVAVKVLLAGSGAGEDAERRFLKEAQEAARLRHPHIVAIHEVGRHEGRPFYSMDLVEGDDLATFAARRRPSPREIATILLRCARAVQHAHDAGVLHRDLKPGNLLIDEHGEPHLTDFGLVAPIEGDSGLTRAGEVCGSPGYMAPEQLRGEAGVTADVYGLGGLLYFLLTGRAPFVAARLPELLTAVALGDPLPPRRLDPTAPRDLETIALRALAREPAHRYTSAAAFAQDLERWLEGRPILARRASWAERAWRWSQRNRTLAGIGALLAISLVAGSAGVLWQWRRAEAAAARTAAHLYSADLKAASDALLAGDLGTARNMLQSCPAELRDVAWGLLWSGTVGDSEGVVGQSSWTVTNLAVSPDGKLVAAAAQVDVVRIWNLATAHLVAELPGTETSWSVAFSPDCRQVFTADRVVKQWEVASGTLIHEFPGQSAVLAPDGRTLFTCAGHPFVYEGEPGPVMAWNVADGTKLFEWPVRARCLAVSHDGEKLAVSDAASTITIYDVHRGHEALNTWTPTERIWQLAFSPDDRLLLASGWAPSVRLWDLADVTRPPRQLSHPLNTWASAYSPDGRFLAVACSDRTVHVWDTTSWVEQRVLRGHDHEVWSVAWQADGRLLSAGRDPRLLRWHLEPAAVRRPIRHDPNSYNIVWLPGERIATERALADGGGEAVITSLRSADAMAEFPGETPLGYDAMSGRLWLWAHSRELLARSRARLDDVVRVPWPMAPTESIVDVPRVEPRAGLAWAMLADGSLDIRSLRDGSRVARHEGIFAHQPVVAAALSPDGRWFVWGGASTELFVLERSTGRRARLEGHGYDVAAILFAPDGQTFVTGGTDGLIFSWTTAAPHRRREIGRHLTSAGQLAFSPDGRVLASLEPGLGVHLWHPATRREIGFLKLPDDGTNQWVNFAPEGTWLAVRLSNGDVHAFPAALVPEQ